ncbi:hypothetical protein [Longimicrobium terrae]|jgi:hypothetical protein|uniref:Uncharacterized protein n=1 Tax=Longimicrobium terrae TaxID=1639882 RepID=A0A841H1W5_9BACT|nr:hypothetical protein [Longimicrobium terrae]MBB4637571.1 hypothetical protein [Longimicrobium terrae]MBB6071968.1 hypothetical protein [Longimicrobium terrae]NNC30513.1 hypothetical protein [Longimicrobium terrae]
MSTDAPAPVTAQAYVERRRARILEALGRPAPTAGAGAKELSAEHLEYVRREGEELYVNELAWEELTDEESIPGGHLTEMVFPAFLAFVDGLLVERVPADALAPARPHPDGVEAILAMLGDRHAELSADVEKGADSQQVVYARAMTAQLIDLVLHRLYRVSQAEIERLEAQP